MLGNITPEQQLLIVNASALAIAYFGIYPSLKPLTMNKVLLADTIVSVSCLTLAGLLFYGSNVRFSLIWFDGNWAVFSIVTLFVFELPLFLWFASRNGLLEPWDDVD